MLLNEYYFGTSVRGNTAMHGVVLASSEAEAWDIFETAFLLPFKNETAYQAKRTGTKAEIGEEVNTTRPRFYNYSFYQKNGPELEK